MNRKLIDIIKRKRPEKKKLAEISIIGRTEIWKISGGFNEDKLIELIEADELHVDRVIDLIECGILKGSRIQKFIGKKVIEKTTTDKRFIAFFEALILFDGFDPLNDTDTPSWKNFKYVFKPKYLITLMKKTDFIKEVLLCAYVANVFDVNNFYLVFSSRVIRKSRDHPMAITLYQIVLDDAEEIIKKEEEKDGKKKLG